MHNSAMTDSKLLLRAISLYGSKTKLAQALGVGKQHVYNWGVARRIPPWRIEAVRKAVHTMERK